MTEIEVPLEKIQEDIHEAVHAGGGSTLINRSALLSAFLAVFAAISALFAGHYANEAMILQIQASDHWSYYQAKGIKLAIAEMKSQITDGSETKIEKYKKDQEEIKAEAQAKQSESEHLLVKHESLATSVTFFQIAIALTAIAVLTRKKTFVLGATGLGAVGILWLLRTFFFM